MIESFGRYEETVVNDLREGLVDTPQLSSIPIGAAQLFKNAELTDIGLRRRYGRIAVGSGPVVTHVVNQGIAMYRPVNPSTPTNANQLVFCQGTDAGANSYLYWNDGGDLHGIISGANPATSADLWAEDKRVGGFFQYNDLLFYWDGGARHRFYDGVGTHAIYQWGFDAAGLVAGTDGADAAGGGKTDGKAYSWVYTWFNSVTGYETNPSPASAGFTPTAPDLQWTITVPADPEWTPEFDRIRIYSTFGDGAGAYFFEREVATAVDLSTTARTITNGMSKADGELGAEVEFDNGVVPKILYAVVFQEKIIAVDADDPNSIVWSKEQNPHSWPPVNKAYIEKDSGSVISGLFVLLGKLYAVKRHGGVFMLTPATDGTWIVDKVMDRWGCATHHSIVVVGPYAFWLDVKGAVRFDGQNVEDITDARIRQTFRFYARGLIKDQATLKETSAFGIHDWQPDRNYVRWIIREQSADVSHHLIYDITLNAWLTSIPPNATGGSDERSAALLINEYTAERYVLTGDSHGRLYIHTYSFSSTPVYLYSDNGENYEFHVLGKWHGDGRTEILPIYVEFELGQSATGKKATALTVEFHRDTISTAPKTQSYALYDATDSPAKSRSMRMDLDGKTCKRFCVGWKLDGKDSDVHILAYTVCWAYEQQRLIGA